MGSFLDKHRDLGLLVVRVGFGLGFIWYHGWAKITAGPEAWARYGGAMSNFGINFGHTFFGFMAGATESIGGLLFAAGLFFRPVSALLFFVMLTAATNHYVTGQGNPGHAVKNMSLFTGFFLIGPGKYSADEWWRNR